VLQIRKKGVARQVNRRQSEWDDHGEVWPLTKDGPSLYCDLTVSEGSLSSRSTTRTRMATAAMDVRDGQTTPAASDEARCAAEILRVRIGVVAYALGSYLVAP